MKKAVPSSVLPAAIMLALTSAPTLAVDPANLQAGPVYFTPTLAVEGGYVDNLFRSAKNEKDTWQTVITPRLEA